MLKVRVYHAYYGCDTGCCGHIVELTQGDKTVEVGGFDFGHPYGGDLKEWATNLAKEEIQKKYPECVDSIDWDSIDIEDVRDNC